METTNDKLKKETDHVIRLQQQLVANQDVQIRLLRNENAALQEENTLLREMNGKLSELCDSQEQLLAEAIDAHIANVQKK